MRDVRFFPFARPLLCLSVRPSRRAAKYYSSFEHEEKRQLEAEVHRLVTKRDPKFTNFIEFRKYKIIYRRYAGQSPPFSFQHPTTRPPLRSAEHAT
jgi:hypothetical protein